MMTSGQIDDQTEWDTRDAEREKRVPAFPTEEELADHQTVTERFFKRIPVLGRYRPVGYEHAPGEQVGVVADEEAHERHLLILVDHTGVGLASEPADTWEQFAKRVIAHGPDVGWAIVETSPFQIVVAGFRLTAAETIRRAHAAPDATR